jgi:hypothetical protein
METLTSSSPPEFNLWGAFMIHARVLRIFVFFLSLLARFVILRAFWLVLFYLRWTRTWVDPFHRRISSNSSRVHRSGRINSRGEKLGVIVFSYFLLIGFVLDDDLLRAVYQLCGYPLCKVSSHSELIWSNFRCWIDFFRELLVNTRHVWYKCRMCPVGQLWVWSWNLVETYLKLSRSCG